MTTKHAPQTVLAMMLTITAIASIALLAQGCNMSQSPNRQVTDAQITTQVKTKLASDVGATSLTNIEVNTTNGVVTLAGQVQNAEIKRKAETVAAAVPGVQRVNNNLQMDPTTSVAR